MARAKGPELTYEIFVNGIPWEDYSPEEQEEIGRKATERMGRVINERFSNDLDMYVRVCEGYDRMNEGAMRA